MSQTTKFVLYWVKYLINYKPPIVVHYKAAYKNSNDNKSFDLSRAELLNEF